MPIRRKPADKVPILLSRVTELITRATQTNQTATATATAINTDTVLRSFTTIKTQLTQINDRFPKFNTWEDTLMTQLISLQQDIDDDIFDTDTTTTNEAQIDLKLQSIHKKLDSIKSLVHALPTALTPSEQRAPSQNQTRQVSDHWLDLNVEENILVSPAIAKLKLSYDLLELQSKLCLLCLAVFPEKDIKKRALIYWWIGESLVTQSRDRTAEEAGGEIFAKLIKNGLIEPVRKKKKSPIVDCCRMHPWIRRMLISVATRAQFFDFNRSGEFTHEYTLSRRACLVSGDQGFSGSADSNADSNSNPNSVEEELVTIFNVDEHYLSFRPELFLKFKKLGVLHLGRWQTSAKHHIEVENEGFLNELRSQKHLKYLSLQGMSRITSIPSSIVECFSLEILDLRACHNLETLPKDISRLQKLTHLDVSECYLLESMPKGIEKLSSLQVLKGFVIGHSRKNPCKLGDLAQLKKLRKLSIHIGSEAVIKDGALSKLKELAALRVLTISWGEVVISHAGGAQKDNKLNRTATLTMKPFELPPKLEKLDLRCFPRQMSPEWLRPSSLQELKKLYIRGGELDRLITETDREWKVEILRLKYLRNFNIEGSYLRKVFPDLRYFEMFKCNQIHESKYEADVEWNRDEDGWDALTAKDQIDHTSIYDSLERNKRRLSNLSV